MKEGMACLLQGLGWVVLFVGLFRGCSVTTLERPLIGCDGVYVGYSYEKCAEKK